MGTSRRLSLLIALGALLAAPAAAHAADGLAVEVLSNRADAISAGDALVAIDLPRGVSARSVRVHDNRRDITHSFARRANGRYEGLVTGLLNGRNVLTATAPGLDPASTTVLNHPNGGPVLSGPQVQPWVCEAGAADSQCNKPVSYA